MSILTYYQLDKKTNVLVCLSKTHLNISKFKNNSAKSTKNGAKASRSSSIINTKMNL